MISSIRPVKNKNILMKRITSYILITASMLLGACQKYLDKEPDNRTEIKTPTQIAQLLTSAYPQVNYMTFCEAMSDNAEDKGGAGSGYADNDKINMQSYRYEVVEVA